MAATRNQHGLTAKQDRFAVLVAQGMKQGDAYRQAYNSISMSDQQVATEASRLRRHPKVSRRIGEILEAAHIGDVDTAQRAFNDLLAALEQAELDRNWTAYSSLMRQRLQFHGLLKDHLIMSQTDTDPEHMISSLAAGDTELAAALHRVIGSYAGFTQH